MTTQNGNKGENSAEFKIEDLGIEIEMTLSGQLGARAHVTLGEHEWPPVDRIDNASDLQLILWVRYLPIARSSEQTHLFNRIRNRILERKLLTDTLLTSQKDYKKILDHNVDLALKLKEIPAFSALDDSQLRQVVARSEMKQFSPGSTIIKEGGTDGRVYYLYKGKVSVVRKGVELYQIKRKGDILGELHRAAASKRKFSVLAVDKVTCMIASPTQRSRPGVEKEPDILIKTMVGINQMLKDRLELTGQQLERAKAEIQRLREKGKGRSS